MNGIASLFLVLFGCSDDLSLCRPLPVAPVQYVSASRCEDEIGTALQYRAATADYPTVIADCVTGRQLAAMRGGAVDYSKPTPVVIALR